MNVNILNDLNLLKNVNTMILENAEDILKYGHPNMFLSIFAMNIRSLRLHFDE